MEATTILTRGGMDMLVVGGGLGEHMLPLTQVFWTAKFVAAIGAIATVNAAARSC